MFDGVVRTAPRSTYILPSITRQVVLDLCRDAGVPVEPFPILQHDLGRADELFLAGTTVEVMPVVQVDGNPVGDGTPGPVTAALADLFRARTRVAASVG